MDTGTRVVEIMQLRMHVIVLFYITGERRLFLAAPHGVAVRWQRRPHQRQLTHCT